MSLISFKQINLTGKLSQKYLIGSTNNYYQLHVSVEKALNKEVYSKSLPCEGRFCIYISLTFITVTFSYIETNF